MPEMRDRLLHLLDELKRRGVLRVAAVYLVAAWAAIQVSDVTFPRLGMPDWTVTFVIVFLAVLFPVVVGLTWVFDLTRTGIRRVPDPEPPTRAADDEVAGLVAPRVRARVPVVLASLLAVPLIVVGLWWAREDARASGLNPKLVAVTPFRIAGAASDLGYLREGLMDLVAARIGGAEGELRVVPPRTMSRRIRDDLGSLDADPDQEQALDLAMDLGAGRLLEGEIVGTASRITVTATLYDVLSGRALATQTLAPVPADSLHALVDAIATQIIAVESGLRSDRLAAVTTRSVPALRAFLDAEHAFRRGQHERAVRAYDRAVQLDTTFALAALGLLRSRGWALDSRPETSGDLARRVVRRGLDRLGPADRAFFEVFARMPGETSRSLLQRALLAAERMPEQADLQYLAGDRLLHFGKAVDVEEALERGRRQLERVVDMDSTYAEPLIHLYELAITRGDTAGMQRYGRLLLAIDSTGPIATKVRYVKGEALDGTRGAPRIDPDTLPLEHLDGLAHLGWGQATPPEIVDVIMRSFERASLPEDVRGLGLRVELLAARGGRPSMLEAVSRRRGTHPWADADDLVLAIYWLRDLDRARMAAATVRDRVQELRARREPGDSHMEAIRARECLLGHFAGIDGDPAAIGPLADALERDTVGADAWLLSAQRTCALYLRTAAAVRQNRPDAPRQVAAFDAHLVEGPAAGDFMWPIYTLALARLWETVGEPERALIALRRRVYTPGAALWTNELNGEQARLADALGRRDEAIAAYRAYLSHFHEPEPPFDERARRAQHRLEVLVGEVR